MCAICRKTPCDSRCPNAVETTITECAMCGSPIRLGEHYIDMDGYPVCDTCISSISLAELTNLLDVTIDEILIKFGGEHRVADVE